MLVNMSLSLIGRNRIRTNSHEIQDPNQCLNNYTVRSTRSLILSREDRTIGCEALSNGRRSDRSRCGDQGSWLGGSWRSSNDGVSDSCGGEARIGCSCSSGWRGGGSDLGGEYTSWDIGLGTRKTNTRRITQRRSRNDRTSRATVVRRDWSASLGTTGVAWTVGDHGVAGDSGEG